MELSAPPLIRKRRRPFRARMEHAVYGSFASRGAGYEVVAKSVGCRDLWISEWLCICQEIGEPPTQVEFESCFFAKRLASGPWAIVGAFPQGKDDQGRGGAISFHALFVSRRTYRRAGCSPFSFFELIDPTIVEFDRRQPPYERWVDPDWSVRENPDPRATWVALALDRGWRVVVPQDAPAGDLMREVWSALPMRSREIVSLASWVFSSTAPFDLLAMPTNLARAAVELDSKLVVSTRLENSQSVPLLGASGLWRRLRFGRIWGLPVPLIVCLALAAVLALLLVDSKP